MKRIVAVLIIMTILTVGCVSVASGSSEDLEKILEDLNIFSLFYRVIPEDFGKDMIMGSYITLIRYMSTEASNMFYKFYDEKFVKTDAAYEIIKDYTKGNAGIIKAATDGYIDWIDGKMTDSQFKEIIMNMVNGIIDMNKTKE